MAYPPQQPGPGPEQFGSPQNPGAQPQQPPWPGSPNPQWPNAPGGQWQQPPWTPQQNYPYGPPPRKSKKGLIIGAAVIGVVLLLALIGGILLATKSDDSGDDKASSDSKSDEKQSDKPTQDPDKTKLDPTKISAACPLLEPEDLADLAGVPGLSALSGNEATPGSDDVWNVGCEYASQDGPNFMTFSIEILDKNECEPKACVDSAKQAGDLDLENVGDAAISYENDGPAVFSVKKIGDHPIALNIDSPSDTGVTVETLSAWANHILDAAEKASK